MQASPCFRLLTTAALCSPCRSIDGLQASLKDTTTQLGALQLEKQGVDNALKESAARENVASAQLRQLTTAHEQQGTRLRQEAEARKSLEDELQVGSGRSLAGRMGAGRVGWGQAAGLGWSSGQSCQPAFSPW